MTCDRCFQPLDQGEHGWMKCPYEARPAFANIGTDDWPGGKTFENLGPEPVTLYSKSEWKRELKARGLTHRDHHVGLAGSDKHPETTRWL